MLGALEEPERADGHEDAADLWLEYDDGRDRDVEQQELDYAREDVEVEEVRERRQERREDADPREGLPEARTAGPLEDRVDDDVQDRYLDDRGDGYGVQ